MWEWFLPADERQDYRSQIMEGPHGSSGPMDPQVVGWLWGFLCGVIAAVTGTAIVLLFI